MSEQLVIPIEELDTPNCPVCGVDFDRDSWDDLRGYHYRSGGHMVYGCPKDCDGEINVVI